LDETSRTREKVFAVTQLEIAEHIFKQAASGERDLTHRPPKVEAQHAIVPFGRFIRRLADRRDVLASPVPAKENDCSNV
jgi:hypothetical protein